MELLLWKSFRVAQRMKLFTAILLTLGALLSLGAPVQAAKVAGVRSYRAPEYTRLVFDLDSSLQYQLNQQTTPQQIVIDLKGSEYSGAFAEVSLENTPIANISSAPLAGGDLRVILELKNKVDPRSFMLGKNAQYGDRLVVDLYDIASTQTAATMPAKANTKANTNASTKTDSTDPIAALAASVDDSGERDIVVAISAGHGGDDPGAIGVKRLQEKDVTLAISRETVKLLNAVPGYKAVLIRTGDYYVGLREQVALARKHGADLFIAIHADAADSKEAHGATVYALSQSGATSEQARMLADKENSADVIGGVGSANLDDKDAVLTSVLLDLSMTGSVATSLEIGDQLLNSLNKVTKLRRHNVEQAAFVVLKSANMPSLLVESGYITNAKDAENLNSSKWRQQFSAALVKGITNWFHQRPPRGTLIAAQQQGKKSVSVSAVSKTEVSKNESSKEKALAVTTYTVQRGDSLSMLAERFHVPMAELRALNKMKTESVQVGQVLKLPKAAKADVGYKEHKIAAGETLSQIAMSYEVSMETIRATNQLKSDTIRPGQVLKIPAS
jgi:N-acetylmuramoyl-L-alanine amidase